MLWISISPVLSGSPEPSKPKVDRLGRMRPMCAEPTWCDPLSKLSSGVPAGSNVLINNAGIYPRRAFLDLTDQEWDEMQDINLKGVYRCMKLVLPYMVAQRSGNVVNISSVTFLKGLPNMSHYIAAKGGVIGLTRAVAREMGLHNIHINCIMPGAIEVEREKEVATPEQMAAIVAQQSFQRRLVPIDIARVCVFLASELSDGMTGQTLNVDGGLMMY